MVKHLIRSWIINQKGDFDKAREEFGAVVEGGASHGTLPCLLHSFVAINILSLTRFTLISIFLLLLF